MKLVEMRASCADITLIKKKVLAHDLTYGQLLRTTIKQTLQEIEVSCNTQTLEVID
jgi:predicted DNA binding CopG/RHH family protein